MAPFSGVSPSAGISQLITGSLRPAATLSRVFYKEYWISHNYIPHSVCRAGHQYIYSTPYCAPIIHLIVGAVCGRRKIEKFIFNQISVITVEYIWIYSGQSSSEHLKVNQALDAIVKTLKINDINTLNEILSRNHDLFF